MRKIVFTGIGKVGLVDYEPSTLPAGHIRVRHIYSLLSAGTERLALSGAMGDPAGVEPGYCAVGRIAQGWEGSRFNEGDIVFTHGAHAETFDVPVEDAETLFITVKPELTRAATFLQLGKVAMHGLHRIHVEIGDWIAVFGLGVVGNLSAQLARLSSANRVIAIDPVQKRRETAEKLGIRTLDPGQTDIVGQVLDVTGGGANVIIETSGSQAALNQSFEVAAHHGQISLVAGHYGPRQLDMKSDFQNKELAILGARRVDKLTTARNQDRWTVVNCAREFYRMIEAGDIVTEPLITHCIKPEDAPEIYKRLIDNDPNVLGVVFAWENE